MKDEMCHVNDDFDDDCTNRPKINPTIKQAIDFFTEHYSHLIGKETFDEKDYPDGFCKCLNPLMFCEILLSVNLPITLSVPVNLSIAGLKKLIDEEVNTSWDDFALFFGKEKLVDENKTTTNSKSIVFFSAQNGIFCITIPT